LGGIEKHLADNDTGVSNHCSRRLWASHYQLQLPAAGTPLLSFLKERSDPFDQQRPGKPQIL